jgi:uncharacterized membrane protein (DUF4010 family)
VLAACTVLVPRVLAAVALLAPALVLPLTVRLAPAFVVGAIAAAIGLRRSPGGEPVKTADRNPLQLGAALQMAAIFQVVLIGLHEMQQRFGGAGLRWSAVLLGLTDVDALTASMATQSRAGLAAEAAAAAITIGVASNTVLKLTIAVTVGRGGFRWYVAAGLAAVAAALVATSSSAPTAAPRPPRSAASGPTDRRSPPSCCNARRTPRPAPTRSSRAGSSRSRSISQRTA